MDQGTAVIVGRLPRDPQFFGEGDKQRAVFSVAYNRGRADNRKANFIDCIAWGKRADIMRDFKKGTGIFITGDIEQDNYTNKEGVKVSRVQVNVGSITATANLRRAEETSASIDGGGAGAGDVHTGGSTGESEGIPF
jgi:single-strand DNA-binding protein